MAEKMILTYRGRSIRLKPLSEIKKDKQKAHLEWVFDQMTDVFKTPEYREYFRKYFLQNVNG